MTDQAAMPSMMLVDVQESGRPSTAADLLLSPSSVSVLASPAVRVLPAVTLPFYSSTSLFAQSGSQSSPSQPSLSASSAPPVSHSPPRQPRSFFDPRPTHKRKQRSQSSASTSSSFSPSATPGFALRCYRRSFPSASLSAAIPLLCSSLSPSPSVSSAASATLSLLAFVSRSTARPYDLSLRRLSLLSSSPLSSLLSSHPVLPLLVCPLLFQLGWEREGETFMLVESDSIVKQRTAGFESELRLLLQLEATAGREEEKETDPAQTAAFHVVQAEAEDNNGQAAKGEAAWEDRDHTGDAADGEDEANYQQPGDQQQQREEEDDAMQAETVQAPDAAARRSSLYSHTHRVRLMPKQPTQVRHSRNTFRAPPPDSGPRPSRHISQPQALPETASSGSSLPHPKTLVANVAGERRTLPVTLPTSFLATAPFIAGSTVSSASSSPRFILQPAVLDLGPLLLHRSYSASLLLTNTSSHYSRFHLHPPRASRWSPLSLSLHYRRGGMAGGLHKTVQLLVRAEAVGRYDGDVLVEAEDGEMAAMQVVAEVVEAEEQWRREAQGRASLTAGVLALTMSSSLPGSLKEIVSDVGRVKEVSSSAAAGEEESKEQLLHARILSNWKRNRPSRV